MKIEVAKEWCLAAARREGDVEIGAGITAFDPEPTMKSEAQGRASWVIIRKSDGEAVLETFSRRLAAETNLDRYAVMPIGEYLGTLNRAIALNREQGR